MRGVNDGVSATVTEQFKLTHDKVVKIGAIGEGNAVDLQFALTAIATAKLQKIAAEGAVFEASLALADATGTAGSQLAAVGVPPPVPTLKPLSAINPQAIAADTAQVQSLRALANTQRTLGSEIRAHNAGDLLLSKQRRSARQTATRRRRRDALSPLATDPQARAVAQSAHACR